MMVLLMLAHQTEGPLWADDLERTYELQTYAST